MASPTDSSSHNTITRGSEELTKSKESLYLIHPHDLSASTSLQDTPALETYIPDPSSASKPHSNYVSFLEKLTQLPEARDSIPWRPGQELPPEKAGDSTRVQQRGAILLSTRGAAMTHPCALCAGGYGRFTVCVTLKSWFQGACSSCIFTSKGNKCSLRTQTSGTEDGRALRYANDSESHSQIPDKPSKKRKRSSVPKAAQPIAQPTTYTSICSQMQPPPQPAPLDLDMLLQASIASDQIDEPESPVREAVQPNPYSSHPDAVNPKGPPEITFVPSPYQVHAQDQRSKVEPLLSKNAAPVSRSGDGTFQPVSATWQDQMMKSKGSSVPGLNILSKAKRREVYDLVTQCQGGIDDLQRQLDTLKSVFGIDDRDLKA